MTPTRRGDHRTLFWVFFVITPLQFVLVGMGLAWYPLYSILIPVFGWLFITTRIAFSGDPKRFLERTAKILVGLLICVYSLSYAPAILDLQLETRDEAGSLVTWQGGSKAGLLFYFVLLVQLADVLQYGWGKLIGRHVIAPAINASRTWEGFCGGVASTTLCGVLLFWVTPFGIWGSACMAMIVAIVGFAGGMTMSAVKRDRGVEDYGTLVQGHAGVLDRIDSICFAAPVFFHLAPHIARLP
jgi:phosphatidate cytidylyltransferase